MDASIVTPIAQAVPSGKPVRAFDTGRVIRLALERLRARGLVFLIGALILVGLPTAATHWLLALSSTHAWTAGKWIAYFGFSIAPFSLIVLFRAWISLVIVADTTGQQTPFSAQAGALCSMGLSLIAYAILHALGIWGATVLLIVPAVMLYVAWIVAIPALAVEGLGPRAAFRRSLALTRGMRWPIFALLAPTWIGATVFNLVAEKLASGGVAFGRMMSVPIVGYVVLPITASVGQVVIAVMVAAIYVELTRMYQHLGSKTVADVFT